MQRRHFLAALALAPLSLRFASATNANAPTILLASVYRNDVDPAGYWVSEKLDGIRGVWDGKNLRFRSGNIIRAPKWFTDELPPAPLDGELWIARQSFDRLSAIVRREVPNDEEWRQVRYMIFEMPGSPGDFGDRISRMRSVVEAARTPWLQQVEQFLVPDRTVLARKLRDVVASGGEGLVLHRIDAPYITGRSDVLLKLKPMLDTEAKVVGYVPGKGRNAGRMGALLLETPEGRRFNLGSGFSDADRERPPAIGSFVTYRYRDLTSTGLPKFASFLRPHDTF